MSDQSYTTSFTVDAPAIDAYRAITDVRSWWNEDITGDATAVGSEFVHEVQGIHRATIRVTELVPGKRVVLRVLDNWFSFIADEKEWVGTEIRFDLAEMHGRTEVRFIHDGLVPAYECYDVCENAWGMYIGGSLRSLIATGAGLPNSSPGERRHDDMLASQFMPARI